MPVTLLAVDDSVTMRKVLEMTFAGEDYRVLTADSADAALAVARAERPALVLADATLEGKSGYELCQALKREMPNVPVLVLSSKLHPYDPGKGQGAHADDHLDKPFDTQQLIDKVRAMLSAPAAATSPKPPVAAARPAAPAPAVAARPPAPAPSAPVGARPAAPPAQAPGARGPAPAPSALRQTIAFGGTPSPSMARPPSPFAAAPTRPAAPAAHPPAQPPARPAAPAPAAAAPVAAAAVAAAATGDMSQKLASLGLNKQQIEGVLALSHEVVERVVWEVVPVLAETIIKEELKRLTAE